MITGLDYNTQREKLKLKAYGRDIQQMVERCVGLPTKEERQRCANAIIDTMKRVVPSQQSFKEREPALWYHLALMSDFKLDIDYPVEIVHEDKMATKPDPIPYMKDRMPVRHYGRLLTAILEKLETMPEGEERDELVQLAAKQMYQSLLSWGMGAADKEKVASDLARYTNGVIQILPEEMLFDMKNDGSAMGSNAKKKKRKKK